MKIYWQSYIRKSTKYNSKWWSRLERIEANSQSRIALMKAAAEDSYYQRILDLNDKNWCYIKRSY